MFMNGSQWVHIGKFTNKNIMRKLSLKFIVICAVVFYAIAVVLFHVTYSYVVYMREEWEVLLPATLIYLIIVALLVFFIYGKRRDFKKELSEVSVDNLVKSIDEAETKMSAGSVEENKEFVGTGIIGLTRYATFCKIIGSLGLFWGVVFLLRGIAEGEAMFIYGLYLIISGAVCLLSILFINALATIVKAAKIYIDNNKNK